MRKLFIAVIVAGFAACAVLAGLWVEEFASARAGVEWAALEPVPVTTTGSCPAAPVVILGASYARGWTPDASRLTFDNTGVNGQESSGMLERFDRDVLARKPSAVVLWGFINDIFRSPRERLQETLQGTRTRFETMVKLAEDAGVQPVLATELTVRSPAHAKETAMMLIGRLLRKSSYQNFVNREVSAVNEWMRGFAAERQLLLLDFGRLLADDRGQRHPDFAVADGSHVSAAGYATIDAYAQPRLIHRLCAGG